MALDATENRLFISDSAKEMLCAFEKDGISLGTIGGGFAGGGVATFSLQIEPITIDCPSDIMQENDPGQCGAVIPFRT